MQGLQSPEYLKTSLASAMTLRMASGRFYRDARNYCVNLLLSYEGDCKANCAYCGLARSRPPWKNSFIRVDWPLVRTEDVTERLVRYKGDIRRVCLSTVFHPRVVEDTMEVTRAIRGAVETPLSVLITPGLFDTTHLRDLRALGADYLGVGLDAASRRVFERTRGGGVGGPLSWQRYLSALEEARKIFGQGKVSCHIIVGIGETDKELAEIFFYLNRHGALVHLFCFYPEGDSRMAKRRRPSLKRFRRIQLISYLVEMGNLRPQDLEFDQKGSLSGLKVKTDVLEKAIESGRPFLTGGCPGKDGEMACNRPFGSCRPGEPFRDFPFHPAVEDTACIRKGLHLDKILRG